MRLILLIVLVLSIAGCKSKYELTSDNRELSDQSEQVNMIEGEQVQKDSAGTSIKAIESHRREDRETETETRVTEYDTSKPVVAETGKPPVLRETITIQKDKKKEQVYTSKKEAEANTVSIHTDRTTEIRQDIHDTKEVVSNIHETRKWKSGGMWFWCGVGGVLALGYWWIKNR